MCIDTGTINLAQSSRLNTDALDYAKVNNFVRAVEFWFQGIMFVILAPSSNIIFRSIGSVNFLDPAPIESAWRL